MERLNLMHAFLEKNHLDDKPFNWITGDASFRRYARIGEGKDTYILMDTPQSEKPQEFVTIDKILVNAGLSAPKIYDMDMENGFLLLEDLGDDTYANLLAKGADEFSLYKVAVDALVEVSKIKDLTGVVSMWEVLHEWAEVFPDWYLPLVSGKPTDPALKQEYFDILDRLFESVNDSPQGLILRDYHIGNLMLLPDRKGPAACGLLDFQDGYVGPIAYDLMSLLEDARRDVSPDVIEKLLPYYMEEIKVPDKELFMRSYHVTAIDRHLRVLGTFVRLKLRDGKSQYLVHLPRLWRLLERHLKEPYMADLKNWLDRNVPAEFRGEIKV